MASVETGRAAARDQAQGTPAAPAVHTQGSVAPQSKSAPHPQAVAGHLAERGGPARPLPLQIQVRCLRGLKDKVPPGSYLLRVSLLDRPEGRALRGGEAEPLGTSTRPVTHGGHFHDVGLYFHEALPLALPPGAALRPGLAFLFELCLLLEGPACHQQEVAWAVFPACDNNWDVVEGKFKCPLLRGRWDPRLDRFRAVEDAISLDLDLWLGNLYFQVLKCPLRPDAEGRPGAGTELPSEVPAGSAEKGLGLDPAAGPSGREAGGPSPPHPGAAPRMAPCPAHGPAHCGRDLRHQDEDPSEASTGDGPRGPGVRCLDVSYLEELDTHHCSVCCSPVAGSGGRGEWSKHAQFALASVSWELELAAWRSQGFWYIILLTATLWFPRLYLHYLGQWLLLWVMGVPVTRFHLSPHSVELCYPPSAVTPGQELVLVAAGPLALNMAVLPWVLVRGACQLLLGAHPDVLSKFLVILALWTVLDPLAVLVVDAALGRLAPAEDSPTADVAKLYWAFVRAEQSGVLGLLITVLLYGLLLLLSTLVLYLYCLRWSADSPVADAFQRTHSEEAAFFVPLDLEISNQELSRIVKRAEQWRGVLGERRQVQVRDYMCERPRDPGPGAATSHLCIYNVYPSGRQQLYRHFLRLPSGAIAEVLGDIGGLTFVHRDVLRAIQEHMAEAESVLEDSSHAELRGRKASIEI